MFLTSSQTHWNDFVKFNCQFSTFLFCYPKMLASLYSVRLCSVNNVQSWVEYTAISLKLYLVSWLTTNRRIANAKTNTSYQIQKAIMLPRRFMIFKHFRLKIIWNLFISYFDEKTLQCLNHVWAAWMSRNCSKIWNLINS